MRWLKITILLLISNNVFAQNNIEVYRNGILGQMYNEQGKYDSAEKYLRKALLLIKDKTRYSGYFSLIKIAHQNSDHEKMKEYFRELSCIYTKDTIYTYLKDYADITIDTVTFNNLYQHKCVLAANKKNSTPHSKAVESAIALIIEKDQAIRKKVNISKRKTNRTEEEMAALETEMHEADSTNFELLYDCIKKYGFAEIETPLSWSRATLIMHIDNYNNFKKIDDYLLKAITEGRYSPADYAYSLDRSLIASGLKPKYYWLVKGSYDEYKPGENELNSVNKERDKIGLPPYPMWTGWGF